MPRGCMPRPLDAQNLTDAWVSERSLGKEAIELQEHEKSAGEKFGVELGGRETGWDEDSTCTGAQWRRSLGTQSGVEESSQQNQPPPPSTTLIADHDHVRSRSPPVTSASKSKSPQAYPTPQTCVSQGRFQDRIDIFKVLPCPSGGTRRLKDRALRCTSEQGHSEVPKRQDTADETRMTRYGIEQVGATDQGEFDHVVKQPLESLLDKRKLDLLEPVRLPVQWKIVPQLSRSASAAGPLPPASKAAEFSVCWTQRPRQKSANGFKWMTFGSKVEV
jgi:hypothetical protein